MMRERWNALAPREQQALAIGAVVVALLLGWALVWQPLAQARARLAQRVSTDRAALAAMRAAQAELPTLNAAVARAGVDRQGKSLLALADASARNAGLGNALKRVEPASARSVRVNFEGANFDQLVGWIENLARDYGVEASDVSADRAEGLGSVNARVTLEEH
jgi:general secretion pathway protein M